MRRSLRSLNLPAGRCPLGSPGRMFHPCIRNTQKISLRFERSTGPSSLELIFSAKGLLALCTPRQRRCPCIPPKGLHPFGIPTAPPQKFSADPAESFSLPEHIITSFPLSFLSHVKGVMAMSNKKNPARYRNRAITVRMTDEEFLAMREKVEESGLSQQTYIIEAVTGTPILPAHGIEEICRISPASFAGLEPMSTRWHASQMDTVIFHLNNIYVESAKMLIRQKREWTRYGDQ